MKLFGFEIRRIPDKPDPPGRFGDVARLERAAQDAEMLLRRHYQGKPISRREMQRVGMSARRWTRAQALLPPPILSVASEGESFYTARAALRQKYQDFKEKLRDRNYTLPF